jgi:hypothetical protein
MNETNEHWIQIGKFKRFKLSELSSYSISPSDHKSLRLTMQNKEVIYVYEQTSTIELWISKLDIILAVHKL